MSERPPYDEVDAARVRRYLESRGRQLVDPIGADRHPNDPFFAPSLAYARHQMLDAFGAKRPDGTRFRVYPAFVESHRPNAFAVDLGEGMHLCGMSTGLVTSLFELAAFTFSQSDLFPEVGNAAVEASPELPPESLLGYWIADRVTAAQPTQATAVGEELIPLDPERRLMAHFLTQLMLRFVWFHELFHGLKGHSGYVAALGTGAALCDTLDDELAMVEIDDQSASVAQLGHLLSILELEADRAAYAKLITQQLAGDELFVLLAEQPLALRLKLANFAAVLMTFLFDQAALRRIQRGHTHPVGQVRLNNLLGNNQYMSFIKPSDNSLISADLQNLQLLLSSLSATQNFNTAKS